MQWNKIETAPKNGTWVVLKGGVVEPKHTSNMFIQPPFVVAMYVGEIPDLNDDLSFIDGWQITEYDGCCGVHYINPTHWSNVDGN